MAKGLPHPPFIVLQDCNRFTYREAGVAETLDTESMNVMNYKNYRGKYQGR